MIGEAIALVAIVGGLTTLAVLAITATQRAGKQEARAAELAVRIEVANANAKNESNRADAEKERANALDAAIVEAAAVGPVAGSFERLLQARRAAGATRVDRAPAVPDGSDSGGEARAIGPDDLLRPGE